MRVYDIIYKKKIGGRLDADEIRFLVDGFTKGKIPDYQMSAFLMAVCFKGMSMEETAELTLCMANSGDTVDLSAISGVKVDKHSTGGVGDKTTLIIAPIVASLGVPIAKMSGRGLGHTGGTVDKLESIPEMKTAFTKEEFIEIVNRGGVCVAGQSGNLAPADKKMYALRDVTATVDSIPLIAASIMSKKIAAGSDAILLDVKTGSGAFMKTVKDSILLAEAMVEIGEAAGKSTVALITDMNYPLGYAIGNSLEIIEAVNTLKGNGPEDLTDVCARLSAEMLILAGKGSFDECLNSVKNQIQNGEAFNKLYNMVKLQGGNADYLTNTERFEKAKVVYELTSPENGFISEMNAERCGLASCILGAGRETENSIIDYSAGIILKAKTGSSVRKGDVIAELHTSDITLARKAAERFMDGIKFSSGAPELPPLVYAKVSKTGVEEYSDN